MYMKHHFLLVFFILLTAFNAIQCCRDEACQDAWNPDCENYDPCLYKANADFGAVEFKSTKDLREIEDSIIFRVDLTKDTLPNVKISFVAYYPAISRRWFIGSHNEVLTDSIVSLSFDGYVGPLSVTLISERTINLNCSGDDGLDTITKLFHIIDREDCDYLGQYNMLGVFRGIDSRNPGELKDIEIYHEPSWGGHNISDFVCNNPVAIMTSHIYGYHNFGMSDPLTLGCSAYTTYLAELVTSDSIRIRYRFNDSGQGLNTYNPMDLSLYEFNGIRVQ
jgi:hypothetical protein